MQKEKFLLLIDDDEPTNVYQEIMIQESELFNKYAIYNCPIKALNFLTTSDIVPDYIFLDINMPKMDAWEFLDEYSKFSVSKICSNIIILSTSMSTYDKKQSKENTMATGYYKKPLSVEMLQEIANA